jgi:hypothetical protein
MPRSRVELEIHSFSLTAVDLETLPLCRYRNSLDLNSDPFDRLPYVNGQFQIPSEPGLYNKVVGTNRATRQISLSTAVRIGFEGQYPSYALLGRNMPYIFNEIILGLDELGRDTKDSIRVGIDKVWNEDGSEVRSSYSNNIMIYQETEPNYYSRVKTFSIENGAGMLKPFLESVPAGSFLSPQLEPSVKTGP